MYQISTSFYPSCHYGVMIVDTVQHWIPNTQCMVYLPTSEDHLGSLLGCLGMWSLCLYDSKRDTNSCIFMNHTWICIQSGGFTLQGQCNLPTIPFWTPPLRRYGRKGMGMYQISAHGGWFCNLTNYPESSSHHPANQQQPPRWVL